jgi:hypothetical protein
LIFIYRVAGGKGENLFVARRAVWEALRVPSSFQYSTKTKYIKG